MSYNAMSQPPADFEWKVETTAFVFSPEQPPAPSCHASTVVAFPDGRLLCAWFAGPREGHPKTHIRTAIFEDGCWQPSSAAADGNRHGQDFPCWNPVLHALKNEDVLLFFKVGPSPREWWGEYAISNDRGCSWTAPAPLPQGFLGPIKNKPVALDDGTLLHPSSTEDQGWRLHFEYSRGAPPDWTWDRTPPLNDGTRLHAIQPTVIRVGEKHFRALFRTKEERIGAVDSTDGGRTWGRPFLTPLPNPNSGIDAVTLTRGPARGSHLLVYNPLTRGRHVLAVAASADGERWVHLFDLEHSPDGEFSYPAVIEGPDGRVHITYTWLRRSIRHVVLAPR